MTLTIHGSGDTAHALEPNETPSAGVDRAGWIAAPLSRPAAVPISIARRVTIRGVYAVADSGANWIEARDEFAAMSFAASRSFFDWEASLAENPGEEPNAEG